TPPAREHRHRASPWPRGQPRGPPTSRVGTNQIPSWKRQRVEIGDGVADDAAGQFFTTRESTDGILGLPQYDEVPVRVEELRELRRGETDETDPQAAIPLGPTPCGLATVVHERSQDDRDIAVESRSIGPDNFVARLGAQRRDISQLHARHREQAPFDGAQDPRDA